MDKTQPENALEEKYSYSNRVLLALFNNIHQHLQPVNADMPKTVYENLSKRMTEELHKTVGYTFQLSMSYFPRPIKVAAVMKQLKALLQSMISANVLLHVLIALEEVIANIVEHSYIGTEEPEIIITFSFTLSQIKIEVDDFGECGRTYNFENSGKFVSLEELRRTGIAKRGGMGVFLVRRVMNEVNYNVVPGQYNRITMVKYLLS